MPGEIRSIPPTVDTVVLSSTGSTGPPWIPVDEDDAKSSVDAATHGNVAIPLPESNPISMESENFSETTMSATLDNGPSPKGKPPFLDPSSLIALGER